MKKENKVIELSAVNKSERAFQAVNDNLKETRRNLNKVSGDLKKQTAVFGRNEKAMKSHSRTMRAVSGKAKGFAAVAGTALAAAFGVSAIKNIADYGDQLDKLSLRIDTTADYLSEMKFVAEQTGLNIGTFGTAMQRATRRINEAAHGTGEARAALAELGLDAKKLNNLPLDQKFNAIADAIDGLGDQADKVRIAMKLFDTEGVALVQTMEGGSAAINALRDEAFHLGATMTDLQADKMAAMNDATNRLNTAFGGLTKELTANLAPALIDTANWLTQLITKTDKLEAAQRRQKKVIEDISKASREGSIEMIKHSKQLMKSEIENTKEKIAQQEILFKKYDKMAQVSKGTILDKIGVAPGVEWRDDTAEELADLRRYLRQLNEIPKEQARLKKLVEEDERKRIEEEDKRFQEEEARRKKELHAQRKNLLALKALRAEYAVTGTSNTIPEAILNPYTDYSQYGYEKPFKPVPEFLEEEAKQDLIARNLETIEAAERTATAIKDTFSDAAKDIITNFNNLEDVANNVLIRLGNNMIDSLFGSLGNTLFGNGDIGHSGIIGGVFDKGISAVMGTGGGVGGSILGSVFGGFFADGGHLSPGKVGIVGEEGPELIYGGNTGKTIVPLDSSGGSFPMFGSRGGALSAPVQGADNHAPIIINNHIRIDSAVGDDNLNRMIESKVHSGVAGGLAQYDRALPSRIQEKNAREG